MKYYYSGGSWIWGNPSYVSSGNYFHLSVGSSSAKYLWTSGSSSPYTRKLRLLYALKIGL